MELIEREGTLAILHEKFQYALNEEGHCVLLSGEAGIGKTSLVNEFCKDKKNTCDIFIGTCDALFTPRPLAPLFDIALQLGIHLEDANISTTDRAALFSLFLHRLSNLARPALLVFEDIHWADDATLDFIKFLARRITRIKCLFILTYREDEMRTTQALRNIFGHLKTESFTRLPLQPFSKESVLKMAGEKGYNGEDVYTISGGNPFYVTEILANYNHGIPENIRDAVLSAFSRVDGKTKDVWELLSVIPSAFEIRYLEKFEPSYAKAIENCLASEILIIKDGTIHFKHELFRRTIEQSLSPFVRVALHKKILDLFKENFEKNKEIERIVHHAKNANDYDTVSRYAPLAAKQAAFMGAHTESSIFYLIAIEYYQDDDKRILIDLYEAYAYECYLVNKITDAIIYQEKALNYWKQSDDIERIGNAMRLLSRFYWYDGNRKKAEEFATRSIAALEKIITSRTKAMAMSNLSQLKMLSDQHDECIYWGEKAIAMAKEIGDEEIVSHSLNNVGTVKIRSAATRPEGIKIMQQSLAIALQNNYEEQAVRAYSNLASNAVKMKDYAFAHNIIAEGIAYSEERGLDVGIPYLAAYKARMLMETGDWNESLKITAGIIKNDQQPAVVKICALAVTALIHLRKGEGEVVLLLQEAKEKALSTMEPQRIIPALVAMLEYEWLTGNALISEPEIENLLPMIERTTNFYETGRFAFWLFKAKNKRVEFESIFEGYRIDNKANAVSSATSWEQLGCPYDQAIALFGGNEDDKRNALLILQKLGASAVYEKLKREMRVAGIKSIPRGIRKTTLSNSAFLTTRELDILQLMKEGMQNKEIAATLFIATKTVDHHISSIFFKLDVNSRGKAVQAASHRQIIK